MIVEDAYRFYKQRYDFLGRFDKALPRLLLFAYRVALVVCRLGVGVLVAAGVRWALPRCLVGNRHEPEVVALAFTENQHSVGSKLCRLGLDVSLFELGAGAEPSGHEIRVSNALILAASLANASETARQLGAALEDPVMSRNSARVIKLCGLLVLLRKILGRDAVRGVVVFNDHSPYSVLAHDLAKSRGLPTVYVQHAAVTDDFPDLYHDWNILFSRSAVDRYGRKSGVNVLVLGDVRFVGVPRPEELSDGGDAEVLVCTHGLDKKRVVLDLIDRLQDEGAEVTLRPHPAQRERWGDVENAEVSAGRSIWQDLAECRYVIGNESSVSLEAMYAGKLFYKCSFMSSSRDMYGFLRDGLIVEEYETVDEVLEAMRESRLSYDRDRLEYFIGPLHEWAERFGRLQEIVGTLGDDLERERSHRE